MSNPTNLFKVQWIGAQAIIHREINRNLRVWKQTLLPPIVTSSLYFIIFGNLIGKRVGDYQGYSYMNFIVPGLIMLPVITNSFSNLAHVIYMLKFQKSIEEILIAPLYEATILLSFIATGILRAFAVGTLVVLVSQVFTPLRIESLPLLLSTAFLASLLFSCVGFINGMLSKSWDDIAIVPIFILSPLTYLGGVFYSIKALPLFWQKIVLLNPIFHMINLFRYGLLGHQEYSIITSFLLLFILTLGAFILTVFIFKRGRGFKV